MRAEPSAGVRLVTTATFSSPCERPALTDAQPFGPTTALVTASAPPGLVCKQVRLLLLGRGAEPAASARLPHRRMQLSVQPCRNARATRAAP